MFDPSLENKSPENQMQLKKSSLKFRVLFHLLNKKWSYSLNNVYKCFWTLTSAGKKQDQKAVDKKIKIKVKNFRNRNVHKLKLSEID